MNARQCIVAIARARRIYSGDEDIERLCQLFEDVLKGEAPDALKKRRKADSERQKRHRQKKKANKIADNSQGHVMVQ